jgi:hypothetical protein
MTTTQTIIASIESRLRRLNEEIKTLTDARAALDGRDSPTITRPTRKASRTVAPRIGRGVRAATEPVPEPVSTLTGEVPRPAPQKAPGPAKRTPRQKRGMQVLSAGQIERLLSENGALTTSALAERANGNRDQILTLLRELEQAGRIRRTGQRRGTRWHAITDEERIEARAAELAARRKTAT